MANKRYSEVNPSNGSAGGGMRNVDGREKGAEYNQDQDTGSGVLGKAKLVVDPNAGAPQLPQHEGAEH